MNEPVRKLGISIADRIWMRVGNFTFKVRQGEFGDGEKTVTEASDHGIKPIWLGFVKRKGNFYVELTGLTVEELDLFERGMVDAIAAARQIVTHLDAASDLTYDDDTPLIPLRALRTAPPAVIRTIRPFIGTEMDPVATAAEQKRYDNEMTASEIPR